MNPRLILEIAGTHLSSRFKQTAIAALGVTFGIGTFIILVSFMTGLNQLLDGLVLNRTPHVRLFNEIKPSDRQPADYLPDAEPELRVVHSVRPKDRPLRVHNALPIIQYLRKQEAVRGVAPQVSLQVFYLAGSLQLNGRINGIQPREEARLFNFSDYIVEGSVEALARNKNGILLGAGLAEKLSLGLGDRIQVRTAEGVVQSLKIVGIYQSGLADIDDIQSYTQLQTAQKLKGKSASYITDIHVKLHEQQRAPDLAVLWSRQFGISAIDIYEANAQFETGTYIRNLITYAVSLTLLLVAGFGIYNILNMLIYEKMNDIAILKATGFSGRDVQWIFVSQALLIGLIGGILGLVLGYCVSLLIDSAPFETAALPTITTYPVNFDPRYYLIGIVFALIATYCAGYFPARRARRIDPVDIIRGY